MVMIEFDEKVDELSANYGIARGKVYDIMKVVEITHGILHLKEVFQPDKFYSNVYKIAEERIRARQQTISQKQSGLETISNETNQR